MVAAAAASDEWLQWREQQLVVLLCLGPLHVLPYFNAGGREGSATTTKLLGDVLQLTASITPILLVYLVNTSMGAFDAVAMDVIKVQHVLVDGHVHSSMQAPFWY